MSCSVCGADNREGARFCRCCGAALAEPAVIKVQPTLEAAEVSSEELESAGEPAQVPPEELVAPAEAADLPCAEPVPAATATEALPQEPEPEATGAGRPCGEAVPEVGKADALTDEEARSEAQVAERAGAAEARDSSEPGGSEAVEETAVPTGEQEGEEAVEPLPEPAEGDFAFWREKAEPLTPAATGTVIADRYVLVEVLDVQDEEILYLAHDLRKCWQCGFEGNASSEAFCAQCGAALDRRPEARLLEVRSAQARPPSGEAVAAQLSQEGRIFLLLAGPKPEPPAPPTPQSILLLVGQRSDPGQVRELNEDSLLVLTLAPTFESRTGSILALFAVADGMGGHEGGEVASKMALQVMADQAMRTIILPQLAGELMLEENVVVRLHQATLAANDAVFLARQKRENDMGTTLTAVLVRDDRLFLAHVGDCRAYRWNADGLDQLTTDHSVIASMIANGQAQPEEIYTHPHRSVIYRCIGDKPMVEVDTDILPLAPGDRIVVCSDGLWEMVHNEGIEEVLMQEADPQMACDLLVKHANAAGGEDNISVIVVEVEGGV
jgi:serine/threonine protein phosphatase PrpC